MLSQPIVVVNKPEAASAVAAALFKNKKLNGYIIRILPISAFLSHHMGRVPYDSATDFTPPMQEAMYLCGLMVLKDSTWRPFKGFTEYAEANRDKIRYSTARPRTPQSLVMEKLALKEKIKWMHVAFKGGPQAIAALLGGHVEASSQPAEWRKHVEAGILRLMAVYREKRMVTPTLLELGHDIVASSLITIVIPRGLSTFAVETLHQAFKNAMKDADFIKISWQFDQPALYRELAELAKHTTEI